MVSKLEGLKKTLLTKLVWDEIYMSATKKMCGLQDCGTETADDGNIGSLSGSEGKGLNTYALVTCIGAGSKYC